MVHALDLQSSIPQGFAGSNPVAPTVSCVAALVLRVIWYADGFLTEPARVQFPPLAPLNCDYLFSVEHPLTRELPNHFTNHRISVKKNIWAYTHTKSQPLIFS